MINDSTVSIQLIIYEEAFLDRRVKLTLGGNDSANALFLIRVALELTLDQGILRDHFLEFEIAVSEVDVDSGVYTDLFDGQWD